jgi:hypothetical protein
MRKVIHKEVDQLVTVIDHYLKRYGNTKIKKDRGKHENKLGVLNYIGWFFVIILIFFDVTSIVYSLYEMYILSTIDDSKIDDIVQELKSKEPLIELWYPDKNYTTLRCSRKKLCCFISMALRIFQSIVSILFYIYIGMKHRVFYGILFTFSVYMLISLVMYMVIDDKTRVNIMCPMPGQYRKLFELGLDE